MRPTCGGRRKSYCKHCLVILKKSSSELPVEQVRHSSTSAALDGCTNHEKLELGMKKAAGDHSSDLVGYSTPKSKKFQIPNLLSCPPAPMKRRQVANPHGFGQRKRVISFFKHPEIELFFLYALHDHISA